MCIQFLVLVNSVKSRIREEHAIRAADKRQEGQITPRPEAPRGIITPDASRFGGLVK